MPRLRARTVVNTREEPRSLRGVLEEPYPQKFRVRRADMVELQVNSGVR